MKDYVIRDMKRVGMEAMTRMLCKQVVNPNKNDEKIVLTETDLQN